jgi:hypothetical protein
MASVADYESQMKTIQDQLAGYGADLPSQINSQIQKAYTPALERSLNTTKGQMGDYLGRYFDTTSMGVGMGGTSAYDLSPTQKLGVMGRELGTMGGELSASSRFSDYLGGQMTDMYGKAMQSAEMGQRNLASQYDRIAQQHQLAIQLQEAEKDRALQRGIASMNRAGSPAPVQPKVDPQQQFLAKVDFYRELRKSPSRPADWNTNNVYNSLVNEAKSLNLKIDPEQLWIALGNTPAGTKAPTTYTPPAQKYFNLTKF